MNLSNLSPQKGASKDRKRIGRGQGSGHGGTATKGHKGQKARSGGKIRPGFEGGQMPLQRRLPKRGFNNPFKVEYALVGLGDLEVFEAGTRVDRELLVRQGIVASGQRPVKVLANGEITKALVLAVDKVSKGARQRIEAAGGQVEDR
ncbi:MAG: 50S ribosomal protein L15 [Thermodesulfobacteriota bacterium]